MSKQIYSAFWILRALSMKYIAIEFLHHLLNDEAVQKVFQAKVTQVKENASRAANDSASNWRLAWIHIEEILHTL